jgi:uroporphyrin-III C-methyltransferase
MVTGHEDPGKSQSAVRWDLMAQMEGTIVILMGVKNLPHITEALIKSGKDTSTPVAIIEKGLQAGQRVVTGTLGTIVQHASRNNVAPPAIIVIGEVARMYDGRVLCGEGGERQNG